jgi:hypothetical protein
MRSIAGFEPSKLATLHKAHSSNTTSDRTNAWQKINNRKIYLLNPCREIFQHFNMSKDKGFEFSLEFQHFLYLFISFSVIAKPVRVGSHIQTLAAIIKRINKNGGNLSHLREI